VKNVGWVCNFLSYFFAFSLSAENVEECSSTKVLICGVCRNVEKHVPKVIENAESLGKRFADYQVIIYENNSSDETANLFKKWSLENSRVLFLSEYLSSDEMPKARTEKIARARNMVLTAARDEKYQTFDYLFMVDLDSGCAWPIDEIIRTVNSEKEWDCVSANDLYSHGNVYRDRYSFRDARYPFGPELIGDAWWGLMNKTKFKIDQPEWLSVYSAFGGMAIYRTKSILPFSYSGIVTEDLRQFYETILSHTPRDHPQRVVYQLRLYKDGLHIPSHKSVVVFHPNTHSERPFDYPYVTVCEHVTLHAAMATHGYGKFYINPKMVMRFN